MGEERYPKMAWQARIHTGEGTQRKILKYVGRRDIEGMRNGVEWCKCYSSIPGEMESSL
jgi:hypothetical protein